MTTYLLDTNTISYYLRGESAVVRRIQTNPPSDLCMSSITAMELWYGITRSTKKKLIAAVEAVLTDIAILPFDEDAAEEAGILRARLERKGILLSLADSQIAGHASALSITLVSSDKAFKRVSGMRVEDWRKE